MRNLNRPFLRETMPNGIHFTLKHTGKMKDLCSLSTSCQKNIICIERMKKGDSICAKCFANAQLKRWKSMQSCLEKNLDILTSRKLTLEEIPIIYTPSNLFRFESFGDCMNETQAINYLLIAKNNPSVSFAAWTKNTSFYIQACKKIGKPSNLQLIKSSCKINQIDKLTKSEKPFFDKVFTVYSKDFIADHNVKINCGAKSCATCRNCYENKKTVYVNEILK